MSCLALRACARSLRPSSLRASLPATHSIQLGTMRPVSNDPIAAERKAVRKELRARRRAIPAELRAEAERRIARNVQRRFPLRPGQRIALYAPLPEELHVSPLIELIERHAGRIYLPRLIDRR